MPYHLTVWKTEYK